MSVMKQKSGLPVVRLFELDFNVMTFDTALDALRQAIHSQARPARIGATVNVDNVVVLAGNTALRDAYNQQADYIFADGMPVVWASKMAATPLPERVTGADLFVALIREAAREHRKVFILGGAPGEELVLENAFRDLYPGIEIRISCPSMQFDPAGEEAQRAVEEINAYAPDMLFVCLGMPKQEKWLFANKMALNVSVMMGVGAAMEFALHIKKRAPLWMQRMGLEWCWRLCSEPGRLARRYLVRGARFIPMLLRERKIQQARRHQ